MPFIYALILEIMLIFEKDFEFSPDGINVKTYKKGDIYDGQGAHAKLMSARLLDKGILSEKKEVKIDPFKEAIVSLEDKNLKKKK